MSVKNVKTKCIVCDYNRKDINTIHQELFQFPPKENPRFQKWITRMNVQESLVDENALICAKHFEEISFSKSAKIRKTLTPAAVPTLFPKQSKVR